jgi:hypothetical protein
MLSFLITGAAIFFAARPGPGGKGGRSRSSRSSGAFMWYPASRSPPWAGLINNDGIEDVMGLIESRGTGASVISLAAFDGSNFSPL